MNPITAIWTRAIPAPRREAAPTASARAGGSAILAGERTRDLQSPSLGRHRGPVVHVPGHAPPPGSRAPSCPPTFSPSAPRWQEHELRRIGRYVAILLEFLESQDRFVTMRVRSRPSAPWSGPSRRSSGWEGHHQHRPQRRALSRCGRSPTGPRHVGRRPCDQADRLLALTAVDAVDHDELGTATVDTRHLGRLEWQHHHCCPVATAVATLAFAEAANPLQQRNSRSAPERIRTSDLRFRSRAKRDGCPSSTSSRLG